MAIIQFPVYQDNKLCHISEEIKNKLIINSTAIFTMWKHCNMRLKSK